MTTQLNNIMNTLGDANFKGIASFVAVTPIKALKKSRKDKNIMTPKSVSEAKTYVYCTVNMGHDYESLVNRRRKKEGQTSNFYSQGSYTEKFSENGMILKHIDKEQYYVRIYRNVSKDFAPRKVVVDGDGQVWDYKHFYNTYAEFLPKKSSNNSQNLRQENEIIVHNYKVENVQYVRRGELEYNNLSVDAFQKLFVEYQVQEKQEITRQAA